MLQALGLAPYGKREITIAVITALALSLFCLYAKLPLLLIVPALCLSFVLYFFRNPKRLVPDNPKAVLSPADGHITHIEEVDEPNFIKGKALMIGIFLSVFDVHLNRVPFAGTVNYIKYTPGKFHDAREPKSSSENEANAIGFTTSHPQATKLLVKQIAGLIARRIVCDCRENQTVQAGDCLGMIKFGSRTELYIPIQAPVKLQVKVGDKVQAGTTILGELA